MVAGVVVAVVVVVVAGIRIITRCRWSMIGMYGFIHRRCPIVWVSSPRTANTQWVNSGAILGAGRDLRPERPQEFRARWVKSVTPHLQNQDFQGEMVAGYQSRADPGVAASAEAIPAEVKGTMAQVDKSQFPADTQWQWEQNQAAGQKEEVPAWVDYINPDGRLACELCVLRSAAAFS